MAWFWGVVAFRAFGVGHGLHCPGRLDRGRHGSTWRSLGFSGFLVSQGVGEVSPSLRRLTVIRISNVQL